jgi:ribose transport system ATP-binding protein
MTDELCYQLEMKGISKSFVGVKALQNVDFSVKAGEIHALIGENGAGKSTLMRVLSGAYTADSGEIKVNGQKVDIANPHDGIENGISVVYQEFALVQDLSVAENIFLDEFREKHTFVHWSDLRRRAKAFLDEVGFGNIDVNTKVKTLSVAYQQVVEICKALTRDAKILVLDEPTAVLTMKEVEQLFKLIKSLKSKGVSIVYVSHRLEEIFAISDRITILKDGMLVKTVETGAIDSHQLVALMIGREPENYFPVRTSAIGPIAFRVENIHAEFGAEDISFAVREGEVLGLSGLVGAGRTEAARAVLGIDKLLGGKIFLNGKEIKIKSPRESFKRGIGFLPENRKTEGVLLRMPIRHNITLSSLKSFCTFGCLNKKRESAFVDEFSQKISIKAASLDNNVESLSGGNQQKVAIARLLATDCKILILDEPTRGVDVGAKVEIYKIINSLAAQGFAVIMISSEMAEIIGICDRAVIIRKGKTVAELPKEELTEINLIRHSMGVA